MARPQVKFIPVKDMLTLDRLWRAYSRDRYGYSVQRALWIASKRQWGPFFKRINWTTGENNAYRKWPTEFLYKADAEKGHLPLTNALRGTQLFQAVMEHEAFGGPVVKQEPMVRGVPELGGDAILAFRQPGTAFLLCCFSCMCESI